MRKKILIVNCYFDELRFSVRRRMKFPQAMAPAYLAGAFSPKHCEIRLYNEQFSGPLESEKLLAFPDMLVLTGLDTAFDRMLHLTAYARTKNPGVVVVAGGPAVRALPLYAQTFFDICCTGDIEELKEVIEAVYGVEHVSDTLMEKGWALPRYDLAYWMKMGSYVESSRNCYYNCSFCTIASEKGEYRAYDLDYLHRQFMALGRRQYVLFIDNNFGSTDRRFLDARFDLLEELKRQGHFRYWLAMVSQEFLTGENLERCRSAGCFGLFSGVESFDGQSLIQFRKFQNSRLPQIDTIRRCLDAGLVFSYGLLMDVSTRTVADLRNEIEFILDTPEIPLPSYISITVPLLKTPYFYDCVANDRLLPGIRLRDLDSTTLTLKPLDPMDRVVAFIEQMQTLSGYGRKVLRHTREFYRRYGKSFGIGELPFLLSSPLLLSTPRLSTFGLDLLANGWRRHRRTFIGPTEQLDSIYRPAFRIDPKYAHYFKPTMLTDGKGHLNEQLLPDLYGTAAFGETRLAV